MSIKKETLDSITTKDKGKAAILPFSTLLLTEPCYQLLQPPPTTLGMGGWDKYRSWKVEPTLGHWRMDIG